MIERRAPRFPTYESTTRARCVKPDDTLAPAVLHAQRKTARFDALLEAPPPADQLLVETGEMPETAEPTPPQATGPAPVEDILHEIATRAAFDALFQQGASVTAGAPTELKFLVDRAKHEIFFLPPKYAFHYDFYAIVLQGPLDNRAFDQRAYDRPDRDFIPGSVTAYDSFVDPTTGKKGVFCFSLWPTDHFEAALLKEAHDAVVAGLTFLGPGGDVSFRPGGPIQDKLVAAQAAELAAAKVDVKSNLEISRGLKFMALSQGTAIGRLVLVEKGAAMPALGRKDVALFLGDVPPTAPPVAALVTTQVQTYNSHLGIKYRQDDTPYFYKALTADEIATLRALAGTPVLVVTTGKDGTITAATQEMADAYLEKIKPKGRIRLTPNLEESRVRSFADLAEISVKDGRWNAQALAAYGRKTLGVVQLAELARTGILDADDPAEPKVVEPKVVEPKVVAPKEPFGVPASYYARFMRGAVDKDGVAFSERIRALTSDPRFKEAEWKATHLEKLRKAIEKAEMPADILRDLKEQLAAPYLAAHPGDDHARMRSSAPVVEDSGAADVKLPNMAGAFDSHTAKWKKGASDAETVDSAAEAMAKTLQKDYAAVWNDRAVSELEWNNVDMDEGSVSMAVLVMPNEDGEKANGVLRVNVDLGGFFSITGETQFGENLVTNPEAGATPDTWIDGNYDILDGTPKQDIEYERVSNLISSDPSRPHAFIDAEIHVAYSAMSKIRDHFAALEGKAPEAYIDECETKVLADGSVQFKQERPWVE